eukprot:m.152606 g.152606  ORF g.152606 m.152606 type:complete len:74 (-) comp10165_c1_seq4:223-444(-)
MLTERSFLPLTPYSPQEKNTFDVFADDYLVQSSPFGKMHKVNAKGGKIKQSHKTVVGYGRTNPNETRPKGKRK